MFIKEAIELTPGDLIAAYDERRSFVVLVVTAYQAYSVKSGDLVTAVGLAYPVNREVDDGHIGDCSLRLRPDQQVLLLEPGDDPRQEPQV